MLKKYSWLAVLLLALTMVFFSCGVTEDDYSEVGEPLKDDPFDFAEIENFILPRLFGANSGSISLDEDTGVVEVRSHGSIAVYFDFEANDIKYDATKTLVFTVAYINDSGTASWVPKNTPNPSSGWLGTDVAENTTHGYQYNVDFEEPYEEEFSWKIPMRVIDESSQGLSYQYNTYGPGAGAGAAHRVKFIGIEVE